MKAFQTNLGANPINFHGHVVSLYGAGYVHHNCPPVVHTGALDVLEVAHGQDWVFQPQTVALCGRGLQDISFWPDGAGQ